jgi:hypothetical protein
MAAGMRFKVRGTLFFALAMLAALLTVERTRAHEEPPSDPYWTIDFHVYQVGLQSRPDPDPSQLRTESVGHGTIRFGKKPRRNVYEIGKVTQFYLDQYDFFSSSPDTPIYRRFGLREQGRKVQVKLGTNNRKIVKLPLVIEQSQGQEICVVGQLGTLTAIQGAFSDGFRTSFQAEEACDFYIREFTPTPNGSGGTNTVTVDVDDLVKHEE